MLISARNVNSAYALGMDLLLKRGVRSPSRAGDVLVAPFPVMTAYASPVERVLFSAKRDANPFFHLFEALWMLAGRDDATWLDRFVGDFSSRFAEVGGRQHGAYGARWRHAFGFDQLEAIQRKLIKTPEDRQCVLQMWDASQAVTVGSDVNWLGGRNDLLGDWKDRPCNTHVYFRVHNGQLDITVCCRSNDAIWGAYGANAVHFSVLQEYMAAMIGVGVGVYYQLSNNFHAYTDIFDRCLDGSDNDPYSWGAVKTTPLVSDIEQFDAELDSLLNGGFERHIKPVCYNTFLSDVAWPMFQAHIAHRQRDDALVDEMLSLMPTFNDWHAATHFWIHRRRMARRQVKEKTA